MNVSESGLPMMKASDDQARVWGAIDRAMYEAVGSVRGRTLGLCEMAELTRDIQLRISSGASEALNRAVPRDSVGSQ